MQIFRALEKIKDEDDNFKKYLKYFVSKSIIEFCSKVPGEGPIAAGSYAKISKLLGRLAKFTELRSIINEKPKKTLEKASELFSFEPSETKKLRRLSYFMLECPLLEGIKVTEVLGANTDESKALREIFLSQVDIRGKDLIGALRVLFCAFFMTGETQVQDRIIGQFSDEYISQNQVGLA